MAKISAPPVESSGEFEHRQIVRVPSGLYGGMFSWYSLPKSYPKYGSSETEEKFFVGFTLTHDRADRQLPAFSEAIMGVKPKRFFSAESNMKSAYIVLLYALLGSKKSFEEIMEIPDEELPDLDDLIGRPVTLFVEANAKADKNGLFGHRVKGLEPANRELIAAIKPLYQERRTETTEKGLVRLKYPSAQFEDEVDRSNGPISGASGIEFDDEIPS